MLPFILALALSQAPNGAALFDNHCASCHSGSDARVPSVATLRQRTPDAIVAALVSGVMRQQDAELSDAERRAVAGFLGAAAVRASDAAAANRSASMNGPGPVVAGGMVDVSSGHGALGRRPGHVLLAFGVDEQAPARADAGRVLSNVGRVLLNVGRVLLDPAAQVRSDSAKPRDLEGVWSYATLTPFERPAELAGAGFFTDAQAAEFEAQTIGRNDRDRRDGGAATDAARGVADFWFDRGEHVASLNGKKRTSWVIDPPDGRVPALTAEARARLAARNADARDHPADGAENRSLQERCLAFNAGPPIGLGPYNNFLQIFQTRDAVVIYTEMIHDARIVWTDGRPHAPSVFQRWLGDSRGRWDGDTFVVDTTNFTDKNPFRGSGENLHLTERFTRTDANTLLYEFTVDDPTTFTRPWTAQLPMALSDERIFEYACHEGNYALPDILRGARYQEKLEKENW